ncbi:hypothetical protein SAMN06265795_10910 [Noviherbaspirillum humi]|uniref:Uncharacterized protein n=1 Tax=Noviherbaspirillum humi TaxID=1688639 RepID=A0A239I902_9BURK|nr:hypothetical protein [Noviherbaspirillum humi]SNS90306.1 hypothetical protein SAMN06265795_10910 [Noviherbaspirillum humi]
MAITAKQLSALAAQLDKAVRNGRSTEPCERTDIKTQLGFRAGMIMSHGDLLRYATWLQQALDTEQRRLDALPRQDDETPAAKLDEVAKAAEWVEQNTTLDASNP